MRAAGARLEAFQPATSESERSYTAAQPVACTSPATIASRHLSAPALVSCSTTTSL